MRILDRINSFRTLMSESNIEAYIINGNDPHFSEYVPERWKVREWISGFTGSFGRLVITHDKAVLWTDSRYFLQAEEQLAGSGIVMMKDRLPDTIPYEEWILNEVMENGIVGVDGITLSISEERKLTTKLSAKSIILNKSLDLVSPIWSDRPMLPSGYAYDYPIQFAGISRQDKIEKIRTILSYKGAEATLITVLDDLAWTFNIRGNDIDYTPVITGYGYIDNQKAILFTDERKIPDFLKESLIREGIIIEAYHSIFSFINSLDIDSIFIDPDKVNSALYDSVPQKVKRIEGMSIPLKLKSIKNIVEISGTKDAHHRDSVAMIRFLYWLYSSVGNEDITETMIGQKLKEFRSHQKNYVGESFHPIAGFAEHGAIVHYHASKETEFRITQKGILLIDSGGHYLDGTTDITRTIIFGDPTEQQRTDFTLVLKGMIQLANAKFPENTKGCSLDILARNALWHNHLNYGHGTGHGVGHFLSVHEGPVNIRGDYNPEPISEGNILSDEPGIYREGEYGIRIENLILCRREKQTEFGNFLGFETLTLCPIDKKLINPELLNMDEINWINAYHQRILDEIGPDLEPPVLEWLKIQCEPV